MPYTLRIAAAAIGLNRSTILRAIKSDTVSGAKDDHGDIEPAELPAALDDMRSQRDHWQAMAQRPDAGLKRPRLPPGGVLMGRNKLQPRVIAAFAALLSAGATEKIIGDAHQILDACNTSIIGRPRKYKNRAECDRAYRERRKQRVIAPFGVLRPPYVFTLPAGPDQAAVTPIPYLLCRTQELDHPSRE
jgi:hypothetical protein